MKRYIKIIVPIAVSIIATISVLFYPAIGEENVEKGRSVIFGEPLSAVIATTDSESRSSECILAVIVKVDNICQLYIARKGWHTTLEDLTKACCIIQSEINDNSDEEKDVRLILDSSNQITGVIANGIKHSW